MECEYCKQTYSTSSSLFCHQRTAKSCLKIQEIKGVIKKERKDFICIYCKKWFTSKYNMEIHHGSCKIKIKEDAFLLTKKHILEETENKIEEVSNTFRNKQVEVEHKLRSKDDTIKDLQKTIKDLEEANLMLRNELQSYKEKEKPYKKVQIPKTIKKMVWNLYVGSTVAETACLCCQQETITMLQFHCGHVVPESKGGLNTLENLRPICGPCNMSMGTQHMKDFIRTFFDREMV